MQKVALMAALALLLAGCGDTPDKQLSEAEAREAAVDAVTAFAQDFASADGGELRLVRGEFRMATGGLAGDLTFEMEWGTQQRSQVSLSADTSGQDIAVHVVCSEDRVVLSLGEQRFEQRPSQGSCLGAVQGGADPLSITELGDEAIQRVDPHRDGSVTAHLYQDGSNVTATIDRHGRLERLDFAGDGGSGTLRVEYGQRQAIQVPTGGQRLPAMVDGSGEFTGSRYEWAAHSATQAVPMADIEVRVLGADGDVVTAFPLQPGQRSQDGFTLTFTDDGDGLFGHGDSFTVASTAWTDAAQYEIVVWDAWAGAAVGDAPIPGWSWVLLLGALGAAARRR